MGLIQTVYLLFLYYNLKINKQFKIKCQQRLELFKDSRQEQQQRQITSLPFMKQLSIHDQYKEKQKQKFTKDTKFSQEKPAKNIKLISFNTKNNISQSQQSSQYLYAQPEIYRQTISKNFPKNPPILPSNFPKNSSQPNLNLNPDLSIQNQISDNPIKTPKFKFQLKAPPSPSALPQPYSYKFSPGKGSPLSQHLLQPQYIAQFQAKFQSRLKKQKQREKGKGEESKLESSDILLDRYKHKDQHKDKEDQIRFLVGKNVKLLENNEKLIKENIQLRQQRTLLRQIIESITKQIQKIQQAQHKQKTPSPSNLLLSQCSTPSPACPIPQQILSYISSLQSQLALLHKIKQLFTQDIHTLKQQNLNLHNECSRKIGDVLYLEDCLGQCQSQLRECRQREKERERERDREVREIGIKREREREREMQMEIEREAREREKDREMDRVMQKLEKYKEKVRKLNMQKEEMRREMELCKREIGDFSDKYIRFFPQDSDG